MTSMFSFAIELIVFSACVCSFGGAARLRRDTRILLPTARSVRVQLLDFTYTPNKQNCDFAMWPVAYQSACDTKFTVYYAWNAKSEAQSIGEVKDSNFRDFRTISPRILAGPIPVGAVVVISVVTVDVDPSSYDDSIAKFRFEYTVPTNGSALTVVTQRDSRDSWYSDMSVEFQPVF